MTKQKPPSALPAMPNGLGVSLIEGTTSLDHQLFRKMDFVFCRAVMRTPDAKVSCPTLTMLPLDPISVSHLQELVLCHHIQGMKHLTES